MKHRLKVLIYKLFKIIYPKFNPTNQSIKLLFLLLFLQKIVGINRKIPWPVHFTSQIKDYNKIIFTNQSPGISLSCYIDARNGVIIKENVRIGPKVSIISQNHDNCNLAEYVYEKPIIIGNDCLLSTNCVILPGVELGAHTIVAAGAIVTKSFSEGFQIIGGIPAEVIKKTT